MWSPETRAMAPRLVRAFAALALAGLTAGCFQPLYGQQSIGGPALGQALRGVDVAQIVAPNGTPEARLAVEVRNNLIFDITGGSGQSSPTHRLTIQLSSTRQQVIVDITTARPDVENYGINASYTLTDLATGRAVVQGQTFSRVSFDIPGQEQRFARARGLRDAENRAAKVISENIRNRLASYFVAGT
jgi:LPS-assembly lipoprotein